MRSLLLLGTILALGVTTPVRAQSLGTVDLGAFFRATIPDDQLTDKLPLGYGGRFGLFLGRNFALELDASRNETEKAQYLLMQPMAARLAYHGRFNEDWTGIIGAGFVRERIDPPGAVDAVDDDGLTGLVGLQRRLGRRAHLRVDGILERISPAIGSTPGNDVEHWHFAVQAGFVWRLNARRAAPPPVVLPPPPPDTDGDGVIDASDACPNTPAGTRVDTRGCAVPVDSDGDGVMDNADRCANTPAGTRVDASGCPVPVDSDGDGVMDNADRCAGTPRGTRVDASGCPVPVDSDGDGVMDNADACPNTARGTPVDARGCARVFEEGRTNIVLEGVTFATGSAILTAEAKVVLDKMAALLNGAPDINVEVQGHTDNTGSAAVNTRLSGARAESVRAYLVEKGVSAARLTAKGYGPTLPVADNATAAGRQQNRRVELKRTN